MRKTVGDDATESPAAFGLKALMFGTFVCSMGLTAFNALAGPIVHEVGLEPWHLGIAITIAGVAWMLSARLWGRASDRAGRRKIILLGIGGFAASYLLLAVFLDFALRTALVPALAFAGLVFARTLVGLFFAAVPTTGAALVADHVPPHERAGTMASIGAAGAVGMVIGPSFAGLIAQFGLALPLYVTAALPAAALAALWYALPGTERQEPGRNGTVRLADRRLWQPAGVAFISMFSVSVAQVAVGFFAIDRLALDPVAAAGAAGLALACVGVSLAGAQVILRHLNWTPHRLILTGCFIGAAGFTSVVLAANAPMLWASYAIAAFGMGWVHPSVSALAANSVEAHEQGSAAGTVTAARGLGTIVGPVVGTACYELGPSLPYICIGLILFLTAIGGYAKFTHGNETQKLS